MPALAESDFPLPFAEDQKAEGARLAREGQVQILEGSDASSIEAKVAFFRRFQRVWIERKPDGRADSECSCPHRENTNTICAHVWAVVQALNERERAEAAASAPPLEPLYGLVRSGAPGVLKLGLFEKTATGGANDAAAPLLADGDTLARLENEADLEVIRQLEAAAGGRRSLLEGGGFGDPRGPWTLAAEQRAAILAAAAATERLVIVQPGAAGEPWRVLGPVQPDPGPRFEFALSLEASPGESGRRRLTGWLLRPGESIPLARCDLVAADVKAHAVHGGRILEVETFGAQEWLLFLARGKEVAVPAGEAASFFGKLAATGALPRVSRAGVEALLPVEGGAPELRLVIRRDEGELLASLSFGYGGREVPPESGARLVLDLALDRQWRRDAAAERDAAARIDELSGWERDAGALARWFVDRARLDDALAKLTEAGIVVVADDARIRRAGTAQLRLRSGIDWFELEGEIPFDGEVSASLDDAVQAWREGRRFVVLDDGSRGLLPAEWMERLDRLSTLSADPEGRLRFRRAQALLLEPILGVALREASDRQLLTLRENLQAVAEAGSVAAPEAFRGTLRPYQQHGYAWLRALADASLGGCLADDMGLGKTVQALALLVSLRERPADGAPAGARRALVVCPRSLLWNWRSEAARFAPGIAVRDHHGPDRATDAAGLEGADVVLTTYGTLQRDCSWLSEVTWSVVILDEAQAIKNPRSKNAECARALQAHLRLALTGTPIENSLRDLWSLMEFLDPGLLGSEQRFLATLGDRDAGPLRAVLARALRPLILRRTKEEVVPELPPKTEQTLLCPLSPEQEALYVEIRERARRSLERELAEEGLERTRFHVLESLLRLRQAACHPALLAPDAAGAGSGKLDLLLDELSQVVGSGHKALVFSQFTTFLRLVADRLDAASQPYAYLDGSTRDRESVVSRFQSDPACPLFLISLKAGGLGLNLTAADYVFILDPWWNPAVEAQAIDRTHRIGQTKAVFAYRLVSQGTVEERILELQSRKRELADAILLADSGPLSALTEEDLRLLLS